MDKREGRMSERDSQRVREKFIVGEIGRKST